MKEVKPKNPKKQKIVLPPQQSANDTSNWENRNVSAATLDKTRKKRIVRQVDFMLGENKQDLGFTVDQARKFLAEQGYTQEEIKQKLESNNHPKKSS